MDGDSYSDKTNTVITPAGEYFIKVNNFSGSANRYVLRLTVAIIPI